MSKQCERFALSGEEWRKRTMIPEDSWPQQKWDNLSVGYRKVDETRRCRYEWQRQEAEEVPSRIDAEWRRRMERVEERVAMELSLLKQRRSRGTIPAPSPLSGQPNKFNLNSPPIQTRQRAGETTTPQRQSSIRTEQQPLLRSIVGVQATLSTSCQRLDIGSTTTAERRAHYLPPPKLSLFDGKSSWDIFIVPFESIARHCGWDDIERLFRLTHCLRGDAAEYAFGQLPAEAVNTYDRLRSALETRFRKNRPP